MDSVYCLIFTMFIVNVDNAYSLILMFIVQYGQGLLSDMDNVYCLTWTIFCLIWVMFLVYYGNAYCLIWTMLIV